MKANGPHRRAMARVFASFSMVLALGAYVVFLLPSVDASGLEAASTGLLILCCISLLLWTSRPMTRRRCWIARGLGGAVVVFAIARWFNIWFLTPNRGSGERYFHWIISLEALYIVCLGAALMLLNQTVRRVRPSDFFSFVGLAVGFTLTLRALFCLTSAACPTGGSAAISEVMIAFLLTWGVIWGGQSGGLLLVLANRSSSAAFLRRLLLLNAVLLPVLGWMQFVRQSRDPYFWEFEIALLIAGNLTVFAFSILVLGAGLIKSEVLRRKAEHRRAQRESDFVATFEQAAVGLAHVSTTGRFLKTNERLSTILGYSREEFQKLSFQQLTYPEDLTRDMHFFTKVLKGELSRYNTEKRYFCKDGSVIWANLTVALLRGPEGRPKYFISVIEDISERKKEQEELKAASETKDRFISVISHELRTPLTPVLAALSAEGDERVNLNDPAILSMMRRNIEHETSIINDLLDLTRISACGRLKLELRPLDLHQLIHEVVRALKVGLHERRLTCHLHLNAERYVVSGDPLRLRQVFINLLDNAMKFTPEGGEITIRTSLLGMKRGCDAIGVEVQDNGPGVPEENVERVFDPFEQGNVKVRAAQGGLGLGLAIVRGLVDAHGGNIELRPSEQGALFAFYLCLTDEVLRLPDVAPVERGRLLRILLVEDHDDTRETLRRLLKKRGHEVIPTASVTEAIAASQQFDIDLVISDIGLPGGSGLDIPAALAEYRPPGSEPVPCIALSGFGSEEDVERSRRAGFARHLTKPVDMNELDRAIQMAADGA